MKQIAEILRKKRIEKRISLESVNRDTRVPLNYLKALEEGDSSPFPAEVYLLGSLRKYSIYIGLNPEELIDIYRENILQLKRGPSITKKSADVEKHGLFMILLVSVVSIIILAAMFGHVLKNVYRNEIVEVSETLSQKVESVPAEEKTVVVKSDPLPEAEINIRIEAVDVTWLKIESDGKEIYEGNLFPGNIKEVKGTEKIKLIIGYAPGIKVTYNGNSIDVTKDAVKDINQLLFTKTEMKSIGQ